MPKVVVAIPCFNEEKFIGDVVSKTREYVDQVIVVDDGSTDDTVKVAQNAGAEVIRHEVNKGYGESIQSCFRAARRSSADILVTLDGDGQHNPDDIPGVLAPIINGEADLVIGSRFLRLSTLDSQLKTNIPRYRKFGIDSITWLYNLGSQLKISDAESGFRAYSARLLDAFPITEKGMGGSIEILIKARNKGFAIKEVPISCLYHSQGSTLNPISHGLRVVLTVIKLRLKSLVNARKIVAPP
jgi:glycosyltransferase involved in cell wall biosynthesis